MLGLVGGRPDNECGTQLAFAEKKTMEIGVRLQDKNGSEPKQEVQSSFPKEKTGQEWPGSCGSTVNLDALWKVGRMPDAT